MLEEYNSWIAKTVYSTVVNLHVIIYLRALKGMHIHGLHGKVSLDL